MPDRLVMVDSCCQCISLRTGSFILAYINMIGSALMLGFLTWVLLEQQELKASMPVDSSGYSDTNTAIIFIYIGIVLWGQYFGFCGILLYGLLTKVRGCLLGYRMFTGFLIVLCIVSIIPCLINQKTLYLGAFIPAIVQLSISYLIVHSYFKQLGGYSAADSDWAGCCEDFLVSFACLCFRACIRSI